MADIDDEIKLLMRLRENGLVEQQEYAFARDLLEKKKASA